MRHSVRLAASHAADLLDLGGDLGGELGVVAPAATCELCPRGSYSTTDGASDCLQCPRGTASTVVGASGRAVCALCAAGTYSSHEGASECAPCHVDAPAAAPNASVAGVADRWVECPTGSTTPHASLGRPGGEMCARDRAEMAISDRAVIATRSARRACAGSATWRSSHSTRTCHRS